MDKSTITKLESIVKYMDESGWEKLVKDISLLDNHVGSLLKDIEYDGYNACLLRKLFIDLAVSSVNITEAKYNGYRELVGNAENTDLLDSIAAKHKMNLQASEAARNKIVGNIADMIASLQALQDKIMRLGNIPYDS